jgi:hypothetical protein
MDSMKAFTEDRVELLLLYNTLFSLISGAGGGPPKGGGGSTEGPVRGAGAAAAPGGQEPGGQPARKVTHAQQLIAKAHWRAVPKSRELVLLVAVKKGREWEMSGPRASGRIILPFRCGAQAPGTIHSTSLKL